MGIENLQDLKAALERGVDADTRRNGAIVAAALEAALIDDPGSSTIELGEIALREFGYALITATLEVDSDLLLGILGDAWTAERVIRILPRGEATA